MELKPTIKDSPNAVAIKEVKGNIEFDDVSFAYHKGQKVLKDINLHIRPDETIALVGQSGSGKTTITKLLMRFYDVSQGEIKLDDQDLRDLKIYDLRRAIGLVPQEAVLFNDTIAYNIAYGKSDATQEEIEEATKKANLHEFVMKLPRKYGTIVGERGVKLSGGQKQRLAIARVILENPEIIIFDEATSQLDSSNERKIQQAFQNLTKNKTTIIIAHRLSTVMDADRIIVFKQGQIVQQGKHQELIKQDGVYKHLWQLQTQKNQVAKNTQVLDN
jgi:ATP-binding cassette subfamily B protein